MALGYSNITLQGIISEWGRTSSGQATTPQNFSSFYQGGSYVPSNYHTTYGIPTSGNLSGSNFFGTNAEAPGDIILDVFINSGHITRLFGINTGRYYPPYAYPAGTVSWVGYDSGGRPAVPYRWGDVGNTNIYIGSSYSNGDLSGYSKWSSSFYLAQGRTVNIYGSTYGGNRTQANFGNGSAFWADEYPLIARDVTSQAAFHWQRGYDRNSYGTGAWARMVTLPGKWVNNQYASLTSGDYNYVDPSGNLYQRYTLQPGEWCVTFNQDFSYQDGPSNPGIVTSAATVYGADWWYNTCFSYWSFNSGYSPVTVDYLTAYPNGTDKSGNPLLAYTRPGGTQQFLKYARTY